MAKNKEEKNKEEKSVEKEEVLATESEKAENKANSKEANIDQEESEASSLEDQTNALKEELEEAKNKYLRLYAEFDTFKRRAAKERIELKETASRDLIVDLLPVLDDFERSQKSIESSVTENESLKSFSDGVQLVHQKLIKTLQSRGVKEMENPIGKEFDSELHEAITQIPAPENKLKGKVIDVIEKGYTLADKVIRYAKVVTGA